VAVTVAELEHGSERLGTAGVLKILSDLTEGTKQAAWRDGRAAAWRMEIKIR